VDTLGEFEARARLKIRDGKLEGFKRQAAELIRQTKEKDTGTLAYDWFISKDGTQCEVHKAYVDADALVQHAINVREARDALYAEFAYDHKMTFYGDPTPRLVDLVERFGVDATWFDPLQSLESADVR
jgi:quinol monooxygenase YgiN